MRSGEMVDHVLDKAIEIYMGLLCLDSERDEAGTLTGAACRKLKHHVDHGDPRRRLHFDPDRDIVWGEDLERVISR